MDPKIILEVAKSAFQKWQTNNATLRAAALAFFTIMPLPSILIIIVGLSALVYGQPQALVQLVDQIAVVAGPAVATMVYQILVSAQSPFTSVYGASISVIYAIVGAIGAFFVLQDTLNMIWGVIQPTKKRPLRARILQRMVPFLLISGTAAIALAWTSLSTVLYGALSIYLRPIIGGSAAIVVGAAQVVLTFGLSVLLFAFVFNQVPDAPVTWRDVGLASLITGAVITALDYLFGTYIHAFPVTSIAGAAGALMVLLLWLFIADEFILYGAQFSNVYAETLGSLAIMKRVQPRRAEENKTLTEKFIEELKKARSSKRSSEK